MFVRPAACRPTQQVPTKPMACSTNPKNPTTKQHQEPTYVPSFAPRVLSRISGLAGCQKQFCKQPVPWPLHACNHRNDMETHEAAYMSRLVSPLSNARQLATYVRTRLRTSVAECPMCPVRIQCVRSAYVRTYVRLRIVKNGSECLPNPESEKKLRHHKEKPAPDDVSNAIPTPTPRSAFSTFHSGVEKQNKTAS